MFSKIKDLFTENLWDWEFLKEWLVALVLWASIFFILIFIKRFVGSRMGGFKNSRRLGFQLFHDLIEKTKIFFFLAVSLAATLLIVTLPQGFESGARSLAVILFLAQVWLWGREAIDHLILKLSGVSAADRGEDSGVSGAAPALRFVGLLVLTSLVVLLALDNLGFNVTALITGLGIGGIAIALAVQNILGDLFASLSILFDKPFRVGDSIQIGELIGKVEAVGLKSTRLRALSGEQVIVSNTDLLSSRIQNYKRMEERRIVFQIGVLYETPFEKLKSIPRVVEEIFNSVEFAHLDRCHFLSFGDSALVFEIVYFVESPDFKDYMDVQQRVNFSIVERFASEGIEFAYPTRTLYVKGEGGSVDRKRA